MELRRQYVFKLIPMLNPDGVVLGHYRTDTRGVNLNRVYLAPNYLQYPSIYAVKALIAYHHLFYGEKMAYPGSISPEKFEKFVMLSKKCRQILNEPEKFGLPKVTTRPKPRYEEPVCTSGDVQSEGHELPKLYSPEVERFNSAEPCKKDVHRPSRYSCCQNQIQLDGPKSTRDDCINGPRIQTREARYLESPVIRHPVEHSQTTTSSLKGKIMRQYFSEQDWVSVFLDENQPPNTSGSRQSELALRLPRNISSATTIPQCQSVEVSLSSMRRTSEEEEEVRLLTSETSKSSLKYPDEHRNQLPSKWMTVLSKGGALEAQCNFQMSHLKYLLEEDRRLPTPLLNRNNCAFKEEDSFGLARHSALSSGRESENVSPELKMLIAHQKRRQSKLSQSQEDLGVAVREKADQDFLAVFENNLGVDEDLRLEFINYCKANHLADPQLLQIPSDESNVQCYIDLHGHCTKRGCFCYGNFLKSEKSMMDNVLYARLIALNSAFFDFGGCNFSARNMYQKDRSTAQSKEGSGRVAVAKHMGLTHCYTIEANYNSVTPPLFFKPIRQLVDSERFGRWLPPCTY
ncbi:unnamed protein product [Dibothriocephalus latus]|uniref:Peptidase M14 domain-containing protein n=1 Tax=Dibothriocephalus latus TaxID=60516 RepID=A0A3P6T512_DIBLA|nr:unnamed protein product [Dibothriocephalus latus]